MSDQVVPNTETITIAAMAIAWEIAKASYNHTSAYADMSANERVKELTNAMIKSYQAIIKNTPIDK